MTTKQRYAILGSWWPRAADANNWRPGDRARRLEVISQAVGRQISSMCELNNDTDIDKVKAHLLALADDISAAVELTPAGADYGYRRRLFWLIRRHARDLGGDPYIWSLMRDKFGFTPQLKAIEDLTTEQLHQLMMTLNARRHAQTRHSKNASLTSEEQFPDQVQFAPDPDLACNPF